MECNDIEVAEVLGRLEELRESYGALRKERDALRERIDLHFRAEVFGSGVEDVEAVIAKSIEANRKQQVRRSFGQLVAAVHGNA